MPYSYHLRAPPCSSPTCLPQTLLATQKLTMWNPRRATISNPQHILDIAEPTNNHDPLQGTFSFYLRYVVPP